MRKRNAKIDEKAFIFKVALGDRYGRTKDNPYRIIAAIENQSLYQLANVIIESFDFDFDHPFGFYNNLKNYYKSNERYELFSDIGEGDGCPGVKKTKIWRVFNEPKKKMLFLFDYGDEWAFSIELKKIQDARIEEKYPMILESHGDPPIQYDYEEEEEDDDNEDYNEDDEGEEEI